MIAHQRSEGIGFDPVPQIESSAIGMCFRHQLGASETQVGLDHGVEVCNMLGRAAQFHCPGMTHRAIMLRRATSTGALDAPHEHVVTPEY